MSSALYNCREGVSACSTIQRAKYRHFGRTFVRSCKDFGTAKVISDFGNCNFFAVFFFVVRSCLLRFPRVGGVEVSAVPCLTARVVEVAPLGCYFPSTASTARGFCSVGVQNKQRQKQRKYPFLLRFRCVFVVRLECNKYSPLSVNRLRNFISLYHIKLSFFFTFAEVM